jgi:hypothetical protein
MTEKLEEKAEKPKILNDKFKKGNYQELSSPRLHDYFIASIQKYMNYLENIQKTFTP